MSERGVVRAGDAEREQAAERLRRAHAEGRLDVAELEERLGRCYAARTLADLDRLVHDLPDPRGRARRPWPGPRLLLPALVLAAVALASSAHVWIVWPLLCLVVFRFGRRASFRGWR